MKRRIASTCQQKTLERRLFHPKRGVDSEMTNNYQNRGGGRDDKTKKGGVQHACRMINAHKAKDKCNMFANFFTKQLTL
jgi:hypothetical protein